MATCGTWSGWHQRPKRGPQRQFILHFPGHATSRVQLRTFFNSKVRNGAKADPANLVLSTIVSNRPGAVICKCYAQTFPDFGTVIFYNLSV